MIQQKQLCFCFLNFKTAEKSFEVFPVLMAYLHTVNWTEGNIIPNIAKGNWFHAKLIIWDIQWVKGDRNQEAELYIYIQKLPKKSIRSLIKFSYKPGKGIIKPKLNQCLQVEITLGNCPLNPWKKIMWWNFVDKRLACGCRKTMISLGKVMNIIFYLFFF